MNLGIAIKSIRKQMGLNQIQFAKLTHITQTTLSQIENGNNRPNKATLNKICNALKLPESLLYILAMENADVPEERKDMYEMVYPAIKDLALKIIGPDSKKFIE